MRAAVWALVVCAAGAPVDAVARRRSSPSRTPPVSQCVKLAQSPDPDRRELVFRLRNRCAQTLDCSITWQVACDGRDGEAQSQSALLSSGDEREFHASAAACGDSWRISPARWSCAPPAAETAAR